MLLLRKRWKPAAGGASSVYHVSNGDLFPILVPYGNRGVYHFHGPDVFRSIGPGAVFDLYDLSFSVVLTLQSLSDA